MNRVFVLLGSNINKEVNLPTAVSLLRQQCQVVAVSAIYETVPVGLKEQPNFWNTAVLLTTPLTASQLKTQVLTPIEQQLGRQRTADKNAPRTIDLDIVLFNNQVLDKDLLKFPHVAIPIAELAPDRLHPETAESFSTISSRLLASFDIPPIWKAKPVNSEQ